MLRKEAVVQEIIDLTKIIQSNSLFEDHILAGGTALALQMAHRTSTDIDLFTDKKQNSIGITEYFSKNFKNAKIDTCQDEFCRVYVNNIKIEIIKDDYKFIKEPIIDENIKMAGKLEISAMKLRAIMGRTQARDFIDIAYLLKEIPLKQMFETYKEKYGNISEKMMKRTILTKCKGIKDNEWLVGIKILRNDIKPEDVLTTIEKGIDDYNKDINVGRAVYDRIKPVGVIHEDAGANDKESKNIVPIECTKHDKVEGKRLKDLLSVPIGKIRTFINNKTTLLEVSKYNTGDKENIILEHCKKMSENSKSYTTDIFHIDKVPPNKLSAEIFIHQFEKWETEKAQKNNQSIMNKRGLPKR